MPSPFTLWGTLGSFFGGSNVHWDRSIGATNFGVGNPLWVDTSTPTAGFVQGSSLSYTIWAAGQDNTGDQNGAIQIAQTTMVFPFVTSSGQNSSASGGVVFSQANGVQTDAVVYWTAGSAAGQYNVKFQALTDTIGNIGAGQTSLATVGAPVTLETNVTNPNGWSYTANSTTLVFGYATGTDASHSVFLQSFNTSGGAITATPIQVATNISGDWTIREDANGNFWYAHIDTSIPGDAGIVIQSFNASTGALGAAATLSTSFNDVLGFDARFSIAGDGKFFGWAEGHDNVAGSPHTLAAQVFSPSGSSFTQLGTGLAITLNSTNQVHVESTQLSNGDYVLVYNDATTVGGSTFAVHMLLFDANGNQLGTDQIVGSLTNFDRIRSIGNGRVEIDWRSGTANNFTVVGSIYDTNTTGQTITGTTSNDILAGTSFADTINAGLGNDTIGGGPGTNTIDGGGGFDRATYTVASNLASLVHNPNGSWTVTIASTGQTDTITNVEVAHFTDTDVALRELARTDVTGGGTSGMILQNGGTVVDWVLSGGSYSSGNVLTTGATGFTVVGSGDINGDGTADVVLQNGGTVVDWVLTNGTYQAGNVITSGAAGFTVKGTGDFNGDGTADIVLQSAGGTIVDWIMKNGQFQSGNTLASGLAGWNVVGTGDFNGDGTTDVLLQNGGTVVDWIMKNGAYQSGNVITTGASGFTVVGTGDFNGDGTTDVVLQNGGTVVDWIIQNGVFSSGNVITTGATGFSVVGTGDYNNDGTADIALQNGGTVVDWIMHNGTFQSGNVITSGATGFTVKA